MTDRNEWLERALREMPTTYAPLEGATVLAYRGKPLSDEWPTEDMVQRDLARWRREDEGRLDVSDCRTFNAWVACADGRTLWEYATGPR